MAEEKKAGKKKKEVIKKEKGNLDKVSEKNLGENQTKTLKAFFFVIALLVGFFIVIVLFNNSLTSFTYEGVDFKVVREGSVTFYNTNFPVYAADDKGGGITGRHIADYNIFLRNDPRDLKKDVPVYGEISLRDTLVIESGEDFNCDGDGIIATANLVEVLERLGTKAIKDPEASCDELGRYSFVKLQPSDSGKTNIEQVGLSCYNININNCEILEGTERFMLDRIVEFNANTDPN